MKPTKHERVRRWQFTDCGLTTTMFDGISDEEEWYAGLASEAGLSNHHADRWLFGVADEDSPEAEVWYLSALDEVWVYLKEGHSGYHSKTAEAYNVLRRADKALTKAAGEPLARWPCPETPEELRTLCRMFYELHGGSND